MNSFAVALLIAGTFLAQQPKNAVSQTELPPLNGQSPAATKADTSSTTKAATKTPTQASAAAKTGTKKGRLTDAQKAAEKKAEEEKWGGKGKKEEPVSAPLPDTTEAKPAPAPASTVPAPPVPAVSETPAIEKKAVSSPGPGKRVAAFWIIVPEK